MASKGKRVNEKGVGDILLLVKTDDGYYAAGPAWKLSDKLNRRLDAFQTSARVPITLWGRALVIRLDKSKVTPETWIGDNLGPPKQRPGAR